MTIRIVVVLLALLATVSGLQAVTFGQPDGNGHPWVGTMLFLAGDGNYYSCSATLIAPSVLVTAAHCTVDNGVRNLKTWVKFAPVISFADRNGQPLQDYLNDPKHGWIQAEDVTPHPLYVGSYPNTYDIGVVKLKKRVSQEGLGALPPQRFLEGIRSSSDNGFTVVGYGMQGYIKPFYGDEWERYAGQVKLVELKSTFDGADMSAKFSNNPGKTSGGSCYGDSGGPVFYKNTNMIVAVVSWGITPCIGVDYNFRLDTPVAQEFLAPYLR